MRRRSPLLIRLNKEQSTAVILRAEPEAIIHELTALAGVGNLKKSDEEFALTNRVRTEVTDTMLGQHAWQERAV